MSAAALATESLSADRRSLRLAQPEEPVAVPVRACHRFGDLRQAAEGVAVPGEALFKDHDALELALPFAHQQRAGPQGNPISGLDIASIERGRVSILVCVRFVSNESSHRLIEIPESGGLQGIPSVRRARWAIGEDG
jgi:hypothetical protein